MAEAHAIALYLSSVAGHHVTRFGTGTLIGAQIDLTHPGNIRWNEQAIVAIPESEYLAFKGEYDRLVSDGAVVKNTAEDYAAFLSARDRAIEAAAAKSAPVSVAAPTMTGPQRGAPKPAAEPTKEI